MPRSNRYPVVGDMIIQNDHSTRRKWAGLVYKIEKNKWGHGTAFLHWSPEPPPYYKKEYGIPCVNVHNHHKMYDVIKKVDSK